MIDRAQEGLHDALYGAAVDLFEPYLEVGGGRAPASAAEVQEVRRACELFERVLAIHPNNCNAAWTLGMARRSIGDYERSYEALRQAYALQPANETVALEHTVACLIAKHDDQAIVVALAAVERDPANAALLSNLALALLLAGRFEEAASAITDAMRLDPADGVIARLRMVIGNLMLGRLEEAEKVAALFVERSPSDPLTARVLQVVQSARRSGS